MIPFFGGETPSATTAEAPSATTPTETALLSAPKANEPQNSSPPQPAWMGVFPGVKSPNGISQENQSPTPPWWDLVRMSPIPHD
jgi:hypothetical protein